MANLSSITLPNNTTYDFKDKKAIPYDAALFTTNTFTSQKLRKLYISKIDNAFYALDKRYTVTVTYDGSNVNDVAQFFDGNYEGNNLHIEEGKTAIFTLDFSNGSGQKFAGYPYGYIYISFYNYNIPGTISGRVYNNYSSQGVGWKNITFEQYDTGMFRARQDYYGLQTLEITITGSSDTPYGYTSPTEIQFQVDRPDSVEHNPIINKYKPQTLYYNLTAPNFIGNLTGNASSATNASKVNNHTVNSDVPANAVFTDTVALGSMTGTLGLDHGGTGATSAAAARTNLGLDSTYTHAVTNKGSAFSSNLYKITTNSEGHVTAASTVSKNDITSLGIPAQDTTYSNMSFEEASAGTATTARSISAKVLHDTIEEFITNPLGAYQTTVGDGTNTTYTINHGLNNEFIVVSVSITENNVTYMAPLASVASINQIGYSLIITDEDHVSITFTSAPGNNAAKVSIISTQAIAEAIDNLLLLSPNGEDYLKI